VAVRAPVAALRVIVLEPDRGTWMRPKLRSASLPIDSARKAVTWPVSASPASCRPIWSTM
jgi:hypothetical protein